MVKLVYCVRKRAELSLESFRRYWLEQHGPLVRRYAEALRARKYVQSHTIEPEINDSLVKSRKLAAPYDGITEVWWDDMASFKAALASPEGREAGKELVKDEATFIDFSQSRVFVTEENVIFER